MKKKIARFVAALFLPIWMTTWIVALLGSLIPLSFHFMDWLSDDPLFSYKGSGVEWLINYVKESMIRWYKWITFRG